MSAGTSATSLPSLKNPHVFYRRNFCNADSTTVLHHDREACCERSSPTVIPIITPTQMAAIKTVKRHTATGNRFRNPAWSVQWSGTGSAMRVIASLLCHILSSDRLFHRETQWARLVNRGQPCFFYPGNYYGWYRGFYLWRRRKAKEGGVKSPSGSGPTGWHAEATRSSP